MLPPLATLLIFGDFTITKSKTTTYSKVHHKRPTRGAGTQKPICSSLLTAGYEWLFKAPVKRPCSSWLTFQLHFLLPPHYALPPPASFLLNHAKFFLPHNLLASYNARSLETLCTHPCQQCLRMHRLLIYLCTKLSSKTLACHSYAVLKSVVFEPRAH